MPAISEALLQILQMLTGLPPEEAAPFAESAVKRHLAANETYIREGDQTRKVAFVEKGLIRAYAVKDNGEEATLLLRWEGQFVAAHDIIIYNKPSRFIYKTLEETTLLEIDYDQMELLLRKYQQFEPLRNHFLLTMLAGALARLESFILLSPEERYLHLVQEKMDIVNRVHDKYLASLLGITPVSLSRIRKRIQSRQQVR